LSADDGEGSLGLKVRLAFGGRRLAAGAGMAALAVAAFGPGLAAAQAPAAGGTEKPFTIGVQEITSYESNPARGNAENAAIRGIKPDDVTFSPSVTATYSHSVGLNSLALNANFGYDYHARNNILSREHLDFSLNGNAAVGAFCSVGGSAAYNRGQSELQYLTVDVTQNTIQTYRIEGSERCGTSSGLTESVSLSHASTQNSNPTLNGYDVNGVTGMLGYSNPTLGTLGLTVSYDRSDYSAAPVAASATPERLDVTSVGLQLTRPIGARLTGTASVSYSHSADVARAGAPIAARDFSGLTSSLNLTYVASPRLQLTGDVGRRVSATLLQGVGYAVVTSADLSATYTVSSRITASVGGSWLHTDNEGRDPLLLVTTPDWQELTTVFARATAKIGRTSAASLEYRHLQGRSDLSLYDYVSNYVGLTLSTSF